MSQKSAIVPRPVDQVVAAAFDEVNMVQLAILAELTPAQRAQIMFELIEFQRQKMYAAEKQLNPTADEVEIWLRVRRRIESSYDDETIQRLRKFNYPFACGTRN